MRNIETGSHADLQDPAPRLRHYGRTLTIDHVEATRHVEEMRENVLLVEGHRLSSSLVVTM